MKFGRNERMVSFVRSTLDTDSCAISALQQAALTESDSVSTRPRSKRERDHCDRARATPTLSCTFGRADTSACREEEEAAAAAEPWAAARKQRASLSVSSGG